MQCLLFSGVQKTALEMEGGGFKEIGCIYIVITESRKYKSKSETFMRGLNVCNAIK